MEKIVKAIDKLEEYLLVVGTVGVVIIIFLQVIMRYIFNQSFVWAEELARYIFVYLTWIGTSTAISTSQHIRMTILTDKFPKMEKFSEVIVTLICLAMSVFLVVNGYALINKMAATNQVSVAMKLPMWIAYMAIPLGGALMTIKYIDKLINVDVKRLTGKGKEESK